LNPLHPDGMPPRRDGEKVTVCLSPLVRTDAIVGPLLIQMIGDFGLTEGLLSYFEGRRECALGSLPTEEGRMGGPSSK
jgi:hypothetical protein